MRIQKKKKKKPKNVARRHSIISFWRYKISCFNCFSERLRFSINREWIKFAHVTQESVQLFKFNF